MSKTNRLLAALGVTAAILLPACSIPLDGKSRLSGLKIGSTYEVRPAMASSSVFEPNGVRSMYFVLRPESPPTIGGRRGDADAPMAVRTTAYTHSESDHLIYGRLSALGSPLKFGNIRSAAADWSRYPLGTKFRIKGQPSVVYEVDDYGSALVGTNTIDLYCPTRGMMDRWGVRNVGIEVLEWGSYSRSAEVMRNRVHYPHVRRMLTDIQSRRLVEAETKEGHSPAKLAPLAPLALGPLRQPYLAMW